ncbi:hypothetical protein OTU49_009376 [Cherax quadricarinatus]|uniref:MDN2-binding protein C-terminal domain-containing protein n=2 Tax=Cherax quadricarinatus TaxID=27406 RepID=A0AAW0WLU2_CHEQU
MLILSEGAQKGKALMVAMQDPSVCGEDVVKFISHTGHHTKSHCIEDEKRILDLVRETPGLSTLHMAAFSYLTLNLPQQIIHRMSRAGQSVNELSEHTRREVEAAASEELLRCMMLIPAPPPVLPKTFCSVLPETAVSSTEWPEYIALAKVEADAEKSLLARRHSGDLLGGLAPPPHTDAILTLEAAQLTKLFTKSGQPVDRVKQKMITHTSSGRHSFKIKSTLQEAVSLTWPESLYAHHHGIYKETKNEAKVDVKQHLSRIMRRRERKTSEADTVSLRSAHSAWRAIGPLRRSPRKHLHQPPPQKRLRQSENQIQRTPQKRARKSSSENKNSESDLKPSDLLRPSAIRDSLRSSSAQNKRIPKPADLSDVHKQKLRVAVVESLEKEGMKMKDSLFKVCFKKLFAVCRPFALDVIGQGSTSKNMEKIAKAHVKQVIEFERLKSRKNR